MLKIPAYAKINLFLDIEKKRVDGYHNIVSLMQSVSLFDSVTLEKTDKGISVAGNASVDEKKDLTYRAAKAFFDFTGIDGGVGIRLEKRIPAQAGLAGGSADASAVLLGLAELYETGLSPESLIPTALTVGSDLPFCLFGGAKLVYGKGDIILPAPKLPECTVLIAEGLSGSGTQEKFAELDRVFNGFSDYKPNLDVLDRLVSGMEAESLTSVGENLYNIFESTGNCSLSAGEIMKTHGAAGYRMTGSGSAVYGLFETGISAQNAAKALEKSGYRTYVCVPVQ